jgi:hypothetical protein
VAGVNFDRAGSSSPVSSPAVRLACILAIAAITGVFLRRRAARVR